MALNPQQQAFKKAYCNPKSATFANATQSAISVGYGKEYAEQILSTGGEWISELVGDVNMMKDAEKALVEAMNYDVRNGGEKIDVGVAGIKLKAATFTSETIGREKFSKRIETDITTGGEKINTLESLPPEVITEMRSLYEEAMKKKLTKGE